MPVHTSDAAHLRSSPFPDYPIERAATKVKPLQAMVARALPSSQLEPLTDPLPLASTKVVPLAVPSLSAWETKASGRASCWSENKGQLFILLATAVALTAIGLTTGTFFPLVIAGTVGLLFLSTIALSSSPSHKSPSLSANHQQNANSSPARPPLLEHGGKTPCFSSHSTTEPLGKTGEEQKKTRSHSDLRKPGALTQTASSIPIEIERLKRISIVGEKKDQQTRQTEESLPNITNETDYLKKTKIVKF